MRRSYEYRLYPNREQSEALEVILIQSRLLYNEALAHRRDVYKQTGQGVSFYNQCTRFKDDRKARVEDFGLLNASSVQCLLYRLEKSFKAFFRRIKAGEKPGFPRFKNAARFRSVEYHHGDGCRLKDSAFYIQNVGDVKIRLHRPVPEGCLKHVVLTRKTGHRWFVCFQGDDGEVAPPLRSGKAVGIDQGLSTLLAFSDGTLINNPRWLRSSLRKLRKANRSLARKVKGSHNRWKQAQRVARLHERIANQRKDYWHKLTARLVEHFARVAVEDLKLKFMTQSKTLALSAHDAGLGMFAAMLEYKAERAGTAVVAVDPRYTSQQCSQCGRIEKKALSVRWHSCPCGYELDRDVNAAVNILNAARYGPKGGNVDPVGSSVALEADGFSRQ